MPSLPSNVNTPVAYGGQSPAFQVVPGAEITVTNISGSTGAYVTVDYNYGTSQQVAAGTTPWALASVTIGSVGPVTKVYQNAFVRFNAVNCSAQVSVNQIGSTVNPVPTTPFTGPMRAVLAKIKAGMAAAEKLNPVDYPPWLPPASISSSTPGNLVRANSTAYPGTATFTNAAGTHQFIVIIAGTSAAAEPAAVTNPISTTAPYNMGNLTDGSLTLQWMGPVRTTTALPGAPSVYSGAKPANLTTQVRFGTGVAGSAPYPYFRFGGAVSAAQGLVDNVYMFWYGPSSPGGGGADIPPTAGPPLASAFVEFSTDAPVLCLDLTGYGAGSIAAGMVNYIEIDGRRLQDGPLVNVVAINPGYVMLDWRTSGGRQMRKIKLSTGKDPNLSGANHVYQMYVAPQDTITFPQNPNRWRLACQGDSIFSGSGSGPFSLQWDRASVFAGLIGCDDYINLGIGGTGFVTNNSGSQYRYGDPQRVADVVSLNPDVLYIGGAYNDIASATNGVLQAAALTYYQTIRSALPNVMIFQAGTYGGVSVSNNQLVDAALLAAVNQFKSQNGDQNIFFIPVSTDNPTWSTGTGNLAAPNGTGNSDIYIGQTDVVHPSQMGIFYLAHQDARAFKGLINSLY